MQLSALTSNAGVVHQKNDVVPDMTTTQKFAPRDSCQQVRKIASAQTHFDIIGVCFSLRGRIPRSVYWFAGIGTVIIFYFGWTATASLLGKESSIALLFWLSVLLWSQLAINVKRFHDLGMSGLWFVLLLLPGIGQCVQLLLLGLQRGTLGENRFGRDPLELFA
jgi:uncharacterized membrane protein YhaH (DUF805 family)